MFRQPADSKPGASFPRSHRLTRSAEFDQVFKTARRSADRYFTVLGSTRPVTTARLGLAVSRKAAPRAVDRNRLKRLTRECFRRALDLPVMDLVVMPRPAARSADSSTLRASLERHWQRLAADTKQHS